MNIQRNSGKIVNSSFNPSSHEQKESHLVMPNDRVGNAQLPTPGNEVFETFSDATNAIKAYAREVGFTIVVEDK